MATYCAMFDCCKMALPAQGLAGSACMIGQQAKLLPREMFPIALILIFNRTLIEMM
jgi:hypothetical protein